MTDRKYSGHTSSATFSVSSSVFIRSVAQETTEKPRRRRWREKRRKIAAASLILPPLYFLGGGLVIYSRDLNLLRPGVGLAERTSNVWTFIQHYVYAPLPTGYGSRHTAVRR